MPVRPVTAHLKLIEPAGRYSNHLLQSQVLRLSKLQIEPKDLLTFEQQSRTSARSYSRDHRRTLVHVEYKPISVRVS